MFSQYNDSTGGLVLGFATDDDQDDTQPSESDDPARDKPEEQDGLFGKIDRLVLGDTSGGGGQRAGKGRPKRPKWYTWTYFIFFCVLISFLAFRLIPGLSGEDRPEKISTNDLVSAIDEDRVDSLTYMVANSSVTGTYWKNSEDAGSENRLTKFTSVYVGPDSLSELMAKHPKTTYEIDTSNPNSWIEIALNYLPALLLAFVVLYALRQVMGANNKTMQFGRTHAKTSQATRQNLKFKDVAGIDEAVEELEEVRDYLEDPERYRKLGAKIPRGVLLVGPPGTGKTLLAKAVAGEAGVPFFSISGSDFVEMFVGVGASRVRDLFKEAKAQSPSIVFIDEIDAVGRQRGAGLGGGHDEREQTLNQLLVEMDGFAGSDSVILIAATNRPDILDPALLRPGRFDRQITVDAPDMAGREQILRVHAQNKPMDEDVDFGKIAHLGVGFTGADLANLLNEAALLTARRHRALISMEEIEESMERIIAGPQRKSRVMTDLERTTIAYHESGHALVGHILEHANPVHKISILSRGQALGYTLQLPTEDHFLKTRNQMLDELAVLLAGRVAEELMCSDITSGASNDLERATKIAREMVTRLGMSEELGTQVFGEAQHEVFLGRDYANHQDYSEETARRIDIEVQRIMREAHRRSSTILETNRAQVDLVARVLLERETVEGDAVVALLDGKWESYLASEEELLAAKEERNSAATDSELSGEQLAEARTDADDPSGQQDDSSQNTTDSS
ncbi:membrane protease FtsH catalytic subunit [Coriobacterium glomerans PW2]|uniref:ATP-dependent zinc metalloprotease FtsH n=1 Tax=Coriobacterium glomerans (strain ATCC 49209 / DSM 20642 / JCM 10262 / PW2) TaxID=700015 RepID=F2N6Y6_CORGP|nr:ATP-dependent zinc metalloprotease FtsH [Coriobacterium glomerans]AEB06185.1 membrane protease FtsH catalytic subunit [Coriobacterium glomerans PW2]